MKKTNLKILHRGCLILSLLLCFLSACHKRSDSSLRPQAVDLYHKSRRLIKVYSDSFINAKDSATLYDLDKHFSASLTALNFKYPAETCLNISEGENDTLTNMTERIIAIRDSLLYRYAHPILTDSVPADSISTQK